MSEHEDEVPRTRKERAGEILCLAGVTIMFLSLFLPNLVAVVVVGIIGAICAIVGWKMAPTSPSENTHARSPRSLRRTPENGTGRQSSRELYGKRLCTFGLLTGIIALFFLTSPFGVGILIAGLVCLCVGWLMLPRSPRGSKKGQRAEKRRRFNGPLEHPVRINEDDEGFMEAIRIRALELRRQNPHGLS